jgi:hypothetical protein
MPDMPADGAAPREAPAHLLVSRLMDGYLWPPSCCTSRPSWASPMLSSASH